MKELAHVERKLAKINSVSEKDLEEELKLLEKEEQELDKKLNSLSKEEENNQLEF